MPRRYIIQFYHSVFSSVHRRTTHAYDCELLATKTQRTHHISFVPQANDRLLDHLACEAAMSRYYLSTHGILMPHSSPQNVRCRCIIVSFQGMASRCNRDTIVGHYGHLTVVASEARDDQRKKHDTAKCNGCNDALCTISSQRQSAPRGAVGRATDTASIIGLAVESVDCYTSEEDAAIA